MTHTPMGSERGLRGIAHHDLGGHGDGMQVMRAGDALYVGHTGTSGAGTSILDVADPARPRLVAQWPAPPHTHTHKVQVADGLLLTNHERFRYRSGSENARSTGGSGHGAGLAVYDLADPFAPRQVGFWESGGLGVHRIVWEGGRYAHVSATPDGVTDRIWVILDLADPAKPVEAARWWWPQEWGAEDGDRLAAHHALVADGFAYLGYDDAGFVVLDVVDWTSPVAIGGLRRPGGGSTHTCLPLPGRGLLVVTDEQTHDGPYAPERRIHLVDVGDPSEPRYLRPLPEPDGDFRRGPLRYGPHNLHENRRGSYRSDQLVFATYFSAGVRVYDVSAPMAPREVAHWVGDPPAGQPVVQANDLFVDRDGLVWVTDRIAGGLSVLEPDAALALLMSQSRIV
jgi:hypothetical protein